MAYRTTIKTLRALVKTLNEITGNPTEAWRRSEHDGTFRAIPGVYVLDCAYGGYRLCLMVSESGGEQDITPRYGAAVTADLIRAYIQGVGRCVSQVTGGGMTHYQQEFELRCEAVRATDPLPVL